MNLKSKTLQLAMASTLVASAFAIPTTVLAGTSASYAVSNMYLWRGQNVGVGGVVSGSLDYSHDNGFYAGVWGSSEGNYAKTETDLYFGFAGESGKFNYDISYWNYLYAEALDNTGNQTDLLDSNAEEVVIGLGFADFSFAAYINVDSDNDDDMYFTFGYAYEKFDVTIGLWDRDGLADEYTHVTFGYAATDNLSFSLSFAQSDDGTTEEDPLFAVTYGQSFDL